MRFFLCFLIFLNPLYTLASPSKSQAEVEPRNITYFHLRFQDLKWEGICLDFSLTIKRQKRKDFILYHILIDRIYLNGIFFPPLEAKLIQKKRDFFVSYVKSNYFMGQGKIELEKGPYWEFQIKITQLPLDKIGEIFPPFVTRGILAGKLSFRGVVGNMVVKGNLWIKEGKFEGRSFSLSELNFQGTLPTLALHDSQVILEDGSVHGLDGYIDARNPLTFFISLQTFARRLTLGEWKLFTRDQSSNIGLIKNIDERFSMSFDAYLEEKNDFQQSGAELRYQIDKNKFFRLRMQEENSLIGFEQRKEF